jgi:hypothetical protein
MARLFMWWRCEVCVSDCGRLRETGAVFCTGALYVESCKLKVILQAVDRNLHPPLALSSL